jgi:type IV pilus assembly protein PilC
MNAYKYQIKRPSGQVVAGVLKAESQMIATQEARALGGTLLELVRLSQNDAAGGGLLERLGLNIGKGVGSKELMAFTSQLACMAKAGIGLTTALDSIGEQITTKGMGDVVRTLKHDVEAGRQFSEALQRFPKVFSVLYVNMVKASELTGSFATCSSASPST